MKPSNSGAQEGLQVRSKTRRRRFAPEWPNRRKSGYPEVAHENLQDTRDRDAKTPSYSQDRGDILLPRPTAQATQRREQSAQLHRLLIGREAMDESFQAGARSFSAPPENGEREVRNMTIKEELQREGYVYQYGCDIGGGDRKEVWLNKKARIAIRIEWIQIEKKASP